ncbi:MAG: RDD family protein [Chloroflexi bacterium]|nr:RDD family protein [Chloroflexota bacterium]
MTTESGQIDWHHWILRLIAIIIDGIIIAIPISIIYYLVIVPAVSVNINYGFGVVVSVPPWWVGWIYPLLETVVLMLYFMVLDTAWGGTIGKRIMGLQVQTVDGGKVPFGKSIIRNISKFYGLVIIDWLIAVVTPGADKRQKYTDRIAGTTVVQTKQPFASAGAPPPPPPPPPPT